MSTEAQPAEDANCEPPKRITLLRKTIPIVIEDVNGIETTYAIKEMTGIERDRFITQTRARWERDDQGRPTGSVRDIMNLQASLIAECLYDPSGKKVTLGSVSAFPATSQDYLYKECEAVNGLGAVMPKKS